MTYSNVQQALGQRKAGALVKFEVRDTDGAWVDLSERFTQDRVVNLGGGIAARAEKETGAFDVQLSTVTVWNGDRFWNRRPPAALFDATTWRKLRCRVSLITLGGTQSLGVFLLDKIATRANQATATLTIKTLTSNLVDAQADRVRQGKQWWRGKPSGFLVRRLLETRHTMAEVEAFTEIRNSYQLPLSDATRDAGPVISAFARPPETERNYQVYGNPVAVNTDSGDAGYGDVWVGLEEELWKFDPTDGVWTYWTKLPADLIAAGAKIHHVYVSTLRQKIVALAWVPEFPGSDVSARLQGTTDLVTHDNVVQLHASMAAAPAAFTEFAFVSDEFFTGLFTWRAGRELAASPFHVVIGGHPFNADADQSGANIPNPTAHWLRTRQPSVGTGKTLYGHDVWNDDAVGASDALMVNNSSPDYWMTERGPYFNHFDDSSVSPRFPADFRFSIGQYAGAFAFNEATDELVLTWIDWDAGAGRYRAKFVIRNIDDGTLTDTGYYLKTGDRYYIPTSLDFNPAGDALLCTGHVWSESPWVGGAPDDSGDDEPVGGIVVEYDWPFSAGAFAGQASQLLHFLSTNFTAGDANNRRRWIPLEARYGAAGFGGVTFIDYTKIGGACYGAAIMTLNGTGTVAAPRWSTGRQSGLVHWDGGAITAPGALFWHDAGANAIVRAPDDGSGAIVTVDDGFPPVDGDVGLAAGLVFSPEHNGGDGALFGISAPGTGTEGDPDVQNPAAPGKSYLYQVGFNMTDRIELADFSGMTVWDALSALASIADFVFGYDVNGAFFFRLREAPTVSLGTIKPTPVILSGEIAASDVAIEYGFDEVFNYAELSPSRAILAEPKGSVQLLERPPGWTRDTWNGEVAVVQRSLLAQKIDLRVVEGGRVGDEDAGCIAHDRSGNAVVLSPPAGGEVRSRLRFAWLATDSVIESQLLEPWEAAAGGGSHAVDQQRLDTDNTETRQDASTQVVDLPRGLTHYLWSASVGATSQQYVMFCSVDHATKTPTTPIVLEAATGANDFKALGLELLDDGTLVAAYGEFGVRALESTDGGATWGAALDVDGGFGLSTRAFCGFVTNADHSILDIITQERGGGGTQDDVYQRRRTGASTWSAQVKIHDSASGSSPWFDFRAAARSGARIGFVVDANVAFLVGDYSNASNQHDQVRALLTGDGWGTTSTVLLADYTGTNANRVPMVVRALGRTWAAWVHTGDLILSFSDDDGATWSVATSPAALTGVTWTAMHDRSFAADEFGGLYAGTFGAGADFHLFAGDVDGGVWVDMSVTGLTNAGDSTGVGDGVIVGTDFWRLYSVQVGSEYELWLLIEEAVVEDPTAGLEIVVPYIHGLDTTRGTDEDSILSTAVGELYGDTVEIGAYVGTVRDIEHDPAAGTTTILLDHSPADLPYPIGTRLVIRSWENNTWSDGPLGIARTADANGSVSPGADGVETEFQAVSTRNMALGMIARPAVDSSAAGDPDLLVTAITDGTTWTGRRVGSGGDAEGINQYRPVRGYLAPVQSDEFPAGTAWMIGPSGVGLIFEIPEGVTFGIIGNGSGGFGYGLVSKETPFMVGDEIHIDCPGLVLDEQELTKQIAMDRLSILKYGVSIFRPARRSPFLNYPRAREAARRIVTDSARPRFVFDVDLPLSFLPELGACYTIEDPRILPWDVTQNPQGDAVPVAPDTARGVAAIIREFTIDPIGGTCKVKLRAVNPHTW